MASAQDLLILALYVLLLELPTGCHATDTRQPRLRLSHKGIIKRSLSASERQSQIRDYIEGPGSRQRPASAGIAVSQRKVRQISDPVQQILIQLHKIIFITQLPPALQCNLKRRIIERFKKSLFSQQSNPCNLKSEMKKLLQGSPELIEPNFFTADWHVVLLSSGRNMLLPDDRKGIVGTSDIEGMTYEQLQTLIEEVLEESSYYNFSSNRYLYHPRGTKDYPAKEENL